VCLSTTESSGIALGPRAWPDGMRWPGATLGPAAFACPASLTGNFGGRWVDVAGGFLPCAKRRHSAEGSLGTSVGVQPAGMRELDPPQGFLGTKKKTGGGRYPLPSPSVWRGVRTPSPPCVPATPPPSWVIQAGPGGPGPSLDGLLGAHAPLVPRRSRRTRGAGASSFPVPVAPPVGPSPPELNSKNPQNCFGKTTKINYPG